MDTGALSPAGRRTAARTSSRIGEHAAGFQVKIYSCDRKWSEETCMSGDRERDGAAEVRRED